MRYWTTLFNEKTWQEFVRIGGNTCGFTEKRWSTIKQMESGDVILAYMIGISRYIGVFDVIGNPYQDSSPIWSDDLFPCRVPVQAQFFLELEYGVPIKELSSKLSFFQNLRLPYTWGARFAGSPIQEKTEDAEIIIAALNSARETMTYREFDRRKLERRVRLYRSKNGPVTVPESDAELIMMTQEQTSALEDEITHEQVQRLLAKLGSDMGLAVWIARNDQGKFRDDEAGEPIRNLRSKLPRQFDEATNRTIELIDVLWLRDNAIVAAFEIEHTTTIYSGLLRMSDLIAMQPNLNIPLYIVAPDERRQKVSTEVRRPTFSRLQPPLKEICRFIPYSTLFRQVEETRSFVKHLRPEFLDDSAEVFNDEEL